MRLATDVSDHRPASAASLLSPASIAVIGASGDPATIGGKPLRFLQQFGYRGSVYPVNPKYDELGGLRCYASVADLPEAPDLAIIAVAAPLVLDMLAQVVERKVRSAIVFSGGFGEAGPAGERLQAQIASLIERSGTRLFGPNCQGFANFHEGVLATFSAAAELPGIRPGPVALVSQSGAFGFSIFAQAQARGVEIGYVVTTGNESDVTAIDAGELLLVREDVTALLMYVESVRDGNRFRALASQALVQGKPIVLLKGGVFREGQSAARSHTGALAGDEAIFDAVCREFGVCRVDTIATACDLMRLFERYGRFEKDARTPQPLAIVSTSGGASVLAADECSRVGIGLAKFSPDAQTEIGHVVPAFGRSENPIDITGQIINDPSLMERVTAAIVSDDAVAGLLVLVTMVTGEQAIRVAGAIARARRATNKPIVVAWTAPERMVAEVQGILSAERVPVFDDPVRAVRALAALRNFLDARADRPAVERTRAPQEKRVLPNGEKELRRMLVAAGFPWCREEIVQTADDAASAARRIGFPVVAKVVSADIAHKTDAGLVRMPLAGPEQVRDAFARLLAAARRSHPGARIEGVAIQQLVSGAGEAIVAIKRDPQFGPTLVLGTGGLFAEVWRDVAVAPLPTTRERIDRALRSLRGYPIWRGVRSGRAADVEALIDVAMRAAEFSGSLSERLCVLEFNPVMLLEEGRGVVIVDALSSTDATGCITQPTRFSTTERGDSC